MCVDSIASLWMVKRINVIVAKNITITNSMKVVNAPERVLYLGRPPSKVKLICCPKMSIDLNAAFVDSNNALEFLRPD